MKSAKKNYQLIAMLLFAAVALTLGVTKLAHATDLTGSFNFITNVSIKDTSGNPLGSNITPDTEFRLQYDFSIPNTATVQAGDRITVQVPDAILIDTSGSFNLSDAAGNTIGTGQINAGSHNIVITFSAFSSAWSNVHGSFWFDLKFDQSKISGNGPETINFYINGSSVPVSVLVDFEDQVVPPATVTKSGAYDAATNQITWTITANPENLTLRSATVTDTLSSGLEFVPGSVQINGQSPSASTGSYAYVGSLFTYTFPSTISSKQVVTFKTTVADSEFYLANGQGKTIVETNTAHLGFVGGTADSNTASVNIPVNFIKKSGAYDGASKSIKWTVVLNSNKISIPNAHFLDTIVAGLTLDLSSIKIDGAVIDTAQTPYTYIAGAVAGTHDLEIDLGAISGTKTITYTTGVDSDYYQSNGNKSFSNTGKLTGTNVPSNASSTTGVAAASSVIAKTGIGYNKATGVITWRVTVNSNKVNLVNPVMTDDVPVGQQYVASSATVTSGNSTGSFSYSAAGAADPVKTGTLSYAISGSESGTYVVQFQTKVLNPAHYANNSSTTYYNTASLAADNVPGSSSKGSQLVASAVLSKSGIGYDYATREITWQVVVNNNGGELNGAVLTDEIPKGHEYVDGSVTVTPSAALGNLSYVSAAPTDAVKSGTLSYVFPSTINQKYTITFKTKVTDLSLFGTNGVKTVSNTAKLVHNDLAGGVTASGTQAVQNAVVSKIGFYTSGNRYIDWKVNVNTNAIPLVSGSLTDQLQAGLALDTSSVALYHANIASDGSLSATGAAIPLSAENVVYDSSTRLFVFNIPSPAQGRYVLLFRTDITGAKGTTYSNSISFAGSGTTQTGSSSSIPVTWIGSGTTGFGETGTVNVTKVDSRDQTKKLVGAKFGLYDSFGNKVDEATGDSSGNAVFSRIRFDVNYTLKEIQAPSGYYLGNWEQPLTLDGVNTKSADYTVSDVKIPASDSEVTPIRVSLGATKTLDEKAAVGNDFVFRLIEGKETSGTVLQSALNDNGAVKFQDLVFDHVASYNATDTYNYTITEDPGSDVRIKYDDTVYTAKVEVARRYDEFTAKVTYYKNGVEIEGAPSFANTTLDPVKVDISASKTFDGHAPTGSDYDFKLSKENGDLVQTVKNIDGEVDFDPLSFDEPGTHVYYISETQGGADTVCYDHAVYKATVTVERVGDRFESHVVYEKNEEPYAGEPAFANMTMSPVSVEVTATKLLNGLTPPSGAYSFDLKDGDGKTLQTVPNVGSGVSFENLSFDHSGTYDFTISEATGSDPTVIYDTSIYKMKVEVSRIGDVFLANVTYEKNGEPYTGTPTFDNMSVPAVSVEVTATKSVDGKTPTGSDYRFSLKDGAGKVLQTVGNHGGTIKFASLPFNHPGTFVYTISEDEGTNTKMNYDTAVYTAQVTVKRIGDSYVATTQYLKGGKIYKDSPSFENTTKPVAKNSETPKTGDTMPYVPLVIIVIGSLFFIAANIVKKDKNNA